MTAPNTDSNAGEPGATPDESQLGDGGKAAIAAERRAKRVAEQALADATARLKEFEDRDKSDLDKTSERATSAEARAVKAEGDLVRLRIAVEKGLPLAMVPRLQGTTEAELQADADELLKLLPKPGTAPTDPPKPPGKPREALRGGGDPTGAALALNGSPIENALRRKLGLPEVGGS